MQSVLGGSRDDNDDDEARAWDDYEKASSALTDYAKSIERAQGGVPDGWVLVPREPTTAILEALESTQQNTEAGSLYNSVDCWEAMLAAAPPINLAAIREVIESHINEAKNLRHDPESQDYLYEQADKLTAALPEKGNG
jgi:hypothetical protein